MSRTYEPNVPNSFIFSSTTEPSLAIDGDLWYDETTTTLKVKTGGDFVAVDAGGPGGGAAWGDITGTLSNQTDVQAALDTKATTSHNHDSVYEAKNTNIQAHIASAHAPSSAEQNVNADWNAGSGDAQILNKPTTFAPSAHATSHQNNGTDEITVTGLSGVLTDPQPPIIGSGATQAVAGNDARLADARTPLAHVITGAAHTFPGGTTTFLRADGTFAAPGGGSDPWTYVQVNSGSDFTTSSATAVDVTGLAFTPAANTTYEFEALLMVRTATATVVPRSGLAWPTGGTDGVAMIEQAGATATAAFPSASGNINAALLLAVGGLLNTTQSWPVKVKGMFRAGASPSGNVRIQLASETAGTVVRIVARSFLKYRTLAF